MDVEELIEVLRKLPPKMKVYKVSYGGCEECNPDCRPEYTEVSGAIKGEVRMGFEKYKSAVII